jgi:hypothetical protein
VGHRLDMDTRQDGAALERRESDSPLLAVLAAVEWQWVIRETVLWGSGAVLGFILWAVQRILALEGQRTIYLFG